MSPPDRAPRRPFAALAATALALTALLGAWAGPLAAPATADVVDRIVLRVNDRIVTLVEYETRRGDLRRELTAREMPQEERERLLSNLGDRVFRDLFEEQLLLSRADQLRITPSEDDVDAALDNIRGSFGIATEDEFAAALAQQGMTLTGFREQVRRQVRTREVIGREVYSQIELEEDDLRRFYRANPDQFRVPERRQVRELVVLESEDRSAEELAQLAANLRAQLDRDRSLGSLAEAYEPEGLTSAVLDLGWVDAGELDPELEAALEELEPGSFSPPTPGRGGIHILELVDREEARLMPFSQVADQIASFERRRLLAEKLQDYMRELEQKAYVQADPPPDAAGFRTVAGSKAQEDSFELLDAPPETTPEATPGTRPGREDGGPPAGGAGGAGGGGGAPPGSAPQGSAPQGSTPLGSTPLGSTPPGSTADH